MHLSDDGINIALKEKLTNKYSTSGNLCLLLLLVVIKIRWVLQDNLSSIYNSINYQEAFNPLKMTLE